MRITVAGALCILCGVSLAASNEWHLRVYQDTYDLFAFSQATERTHYFGVYLSPAALLGGTELHLFPNGRFVIAESSDIAADETQALGSYKVSHSRLELKFESIKPKREALKAEYSNLYIAWGHIHKGKYLTGFEVFVFSENEWHKMQRTSDAEFLQRRKEYTDWQRKLRELERI
jgi:hypothetical protein